jgi:hypothetical protein
MFPGRPVDGETRYHTAANVATLTFDSAADAFVTTGERFPDALAASSHAGALGSPLLLTEAPEALGARSATWLADRCPEIDAVRAVGGVAAVSPATLDAAVDAAEACVEVAWTTCTPTASTVEHPAHWATNTEAIDQLPPCALFDADPEQRIAFHD